jgi:hypothetical protein
MKSGLFGFWLLASFRLSHRVFKPAPSPKPRQKPKILAAHRYIFSVNALAIERAEVLAGTVVGALLFQGSEQAPRAGTENFFFGDVVHGDGNSQQ